MPTRGDIKLAVGVYWSAGAGGRMEPDVAQALAFAYFIALRRVSSMPPIIITQGAFNRDTPGQAHDDGGAVDLRTRHMTDTERAALISALTEVGFVSYDLGPPDYGPHIHAVFTHSSTLNTAAKLQIARARRA